VKKYINFGSLNFTANLNDAPPIYKSGLILPEPTNMWNDVTKYLLWLIAEHTSLTVLNWIPSITGVWWVINCKGFGRMRSWPIRCNKLVFGWTGWGKPKTNGSPASRNPGAIWNGPLFNTCRWALPLHQHSWLQRTTAENGLSLL